MRRRLGSRWSGRRLLGPALAGAGALTLCTAALLGGAPAGPAGAASAATGGRPVLAYVTDSAAGYLSVIDTTATPPAVTTTIPLSLKPSATCTAAPTTCKATKTFPLGITASPGETTIYVDCSATTTNLTATAHTGAIDVVDVATDKVTQVIPVTGSPEASAISPDGKTLFVAAIQTVVTHKGEVDVVHLGSSPTVTTPPIKLPTTATLPTPTDFPSPESIVVGANGTRVGVLATGKTSTVLDLYTVTTTGIGATPTQVVSTTTTAPGGVAVTPTNSSDAYVLGLHDLTPVSFSGTKSTAVALSTLTPFNVAISPNGSTVVSTGFYFTSTAKKDVYEAVPVTFPGGAVGTPVDVATDPEGLAFLPNDSRLYVVDRGTVAHTGTVSVLDTVTTRLRTIHLYTASFPTGATHATAPSPRAIAFGQAPATTTTTTTSSTTTTSTTTTTTTTTAPPLVPTGTGGGPSGAQLAFTGENPTPELALGASLLAAGLGVLALDAWRRRSAAHRALHRRS